MQYFYLIMAFLGGVVLPMQIGLNTVVAKLTNNPIWTSAISFAIGTVGMFAYFLLSRQAWPSFAIISTVPPYAWLGGLLGAFYVTITILAAPKIGAAMLISLVVAGQMLAAMLLDHYGAFGFPQHSINWGRVLGALLVIVGVILVRKY